MDIWIENNDVILAIELKYKTRKLQVRIGRKMFNLLNQSAQDQGRYDFLKDVSRLEKISLSHVNLLGYAIFLTNDSSYWKPPRSNKTVDADFRIHQGSTITGKLRWGSNASKGTTRDREEAILIKGVYTSDWRDYSKPVEATYGKFKYLIYEVSASIDPTENKIST